MQAPLHPLQKTKSILTRTSSMSTKGSACGGATKCVKFVEIPEVHYRSGCYDEDYEGNDYSYGYRSTDGNNDPEAYEDDDESVGVGARGEGQEGMVLRECMGIDVEAIDMDIDTYLGTSPRKEDKEPKLTFRRRQGKGFSVGNLLSRGNKKEKEADEERIREKEQIQLTNEGKEKEKTIGSGLKRLMNLTTRKAPPPALTLSISSPVPLGSKSPTSTDVDVFGTVTNKRLGQSSPPVSPTRRPAISGPYVLGSYLPHHSSTSSRSTATHSPLPSPSPSLTQHPIPNQPPLLLSSSNTSLNKFNSGTRRHPYHHRPSQDVFFNGSPYSKLPPVRGHRTNPSTTTAAGIGLNTERPVGPNIAGTRPKGIIGSDILSLDAGPIQIRSAPSYESFRSAKSYGERSLRSVDVGSVKSSGGASIRNFKAWMSRMGTGTGVGLPGISLAVAE